MNIEELSNLTDEELRVKCAELCGWEWKNNYWLDPTGNTAFDCPNFQSDLNAMHAAERALIEMRDGHVWKCQIQDYDDVLWVVTSHRTNPEREARFCSPTYSTARQRCIAFIATKGKK